IKRPHLVVFLSQWPVDLIPNAEIQRQVRTNLPVILKKCVGRLAPGMSVWLCEGDITGCLEWISEYEVRQWVSCNGGAAERKCAAAIRHEDEIHRLEISVESGLERVQSLLKRNRFHNRKRLVHARLRHVRGIPDRFKPGDGKSRDALRNSKEIRGGS